MMENLAKWKNMSLKDIHYAANIINPKFNVERLSRDQEIKGTEFIDNLAMRINDTEHSIEIVSDLAEY